MEGMRAILLLLTLIGLVPGQVSAQLEAQRPGFSVSPALVDIPVAPNETSTVDLAVVNTSDQFVPVTASIVNFEPSDELGHALFYEEDRASYNAREWFALSETDFIFEPLEKKKIAVSITLPATAEPGTHMAAVLFTALTPPAQPTGHAVAVQAQVAVPFFLTVAGDIQVSGRLVSLEVPSVHYGGPLTIGARVENTGNVHVQVEGEVAIRNMRGREVAVLSFEQGIVTPGRRRLYQTTWRPDWAFGRYQVTATLHYKGETFTSERQVWFLPFSLLFLAGSTMIGTVVYLKTRGRWRVAWDVFRGKYATLPKDTAFTPPQPLTGKRKSLYHERTRRKQKHGTKSKRIRGR